MPKAIYEFEQFMGEFHDSPMFRRSPLGGRGLKHLAICSLPKRKAQPLKLRLGLGRGYW